MRRERWRVALPADLSANEAVRKGWLEVWGASLLSSVGRPSRALLSKVRKSCATFAPR
jgi:hypothetical protein